MIDSWVKFVKGHTHLLLIAAGVFVFWRGLGIIDNYRLDLASNKNNAAQATLQAQVARNEETAKQVDLLKQQNDSLQASLTRTDGLLQQAVNARNTAVSKQQTTDASLPLTDLAARQQTLAGLSSGISTVNGQVTETPAAAIAVTQQLELVPVLKQDNQDLKTLADNKDKQITSLGGVVSGLNGQVSGLNTQLVDAGKACDAKIGVLKAEARKSKRGWFVKGLAIGAAIGAYLALHL